jgi:hypothetical protein
MEIKDLIKEIKNARNEINDNIISMLNRHNTTEIDCYEYDDCPIVISGTNDDCMTLDRVELSNNNTIILGCSGSWNNDYISIRELDIELLIEVYEWLIANEDILFYEEEE